jgi:hypothetical protein
MVSINVVVVESHQHTLEHIHDIIRKRKIFNKPWSLLHFDAHPDLACPTVPAIACFTPRRAILEPNDDDDSSEDEKNLYELLDSTSSGIAEWILPLVLAADLRVIEWVKPSFAKQLPWGLHRYTVGAYCHDESTNANEIKSFLDLSPKAQLKVDWNHAYYSDDDSVVPSEQLALPQTLQLHVSELEREGRLVLSGDDPWVLDICLDYFACLNPYLTDIDKEDPAITQAFLTLMQQSRCCNNQPAGPSHLQDILQFRQLLTEVLSTSNTTNTSSLMEQLSGYYDSTEEATTLIETLQKLLMENDKSFDLVLEALPYWNMPHAISSLDDERIAESIQRVEEALHQYRDRDPPFIITIARSTDDGFTPASVVEEIQGQVIAMLHRIFCGDDHCSKGSSSSSECCLLQFTRDYGEWEGSTI